jgi:hypothetical protein
MYPSNLASTDKQYQFWYQLLPETRKIEICQGIEDYNQISSVGVMCSGKISND